MFLIDSPISEENFNRIIDFMELNPEQTVLDVGCGKGTLLKSLFEKYGISGIGVDRSEERIEVARHQIGDNPRIELITADINDLEIDRRFDVVCCFGEWYGFPGLDFLSRYLNTDGIILYGTNIWRKKPDADYINRFGNDETERDFRTLDESIDYYYLNGSEVLYLYTSTKEECDHYQSSIWKSRTYSDMNEDRERKAQYVKWIREYHGWSAWILRRFPG